MKYLTLVLLTLLLAGCNLTDRFVFMSKKDWEDQKAKLELQYNEKASNIIASVEQKRKEKEEKELANLQKASGLAYGIMQLSEIKPVTERTRPDTLVNLKSKELVTRLPSLPPEELIRVNEELVKELDERNTTIAALQKKYNETLAQAVKDKELIKNIQLEIDTKKNELNEVNKAKQEALLKLADARAERDIIEKAKLQEQLDNEAARAELIKYLIKIFIGIGVLAAVGAYATRSLILAIGSVAAFGLSIFIAMIPPWLVIVIGCAIIACIIAGIVYKWHLTRKEGLTEKEIADRLVGSIEEFKQKAGVDNFKTKMAPIIDDWIKDAPELKDKIKNKLKELNLA